MKSSEGDAKFTISLEGKSSENFDVKLESENGIVCDGTELSNYTMNSNDQELKLNLFIRSSEVGE